MRAFETWIDETTPAKSRPVFVALNAAFDWMFVNDYFHRYLGRNPFGHFALDIKALYMGLKRVDSPARVMGLIDRDYPRDNPLTHNALQDAIDQARLFNKIMDEIRSNGISRSQNV
jgi:DNA polymerase III epsilon subunit-like protein